MKRQCSFEIEGNIRKERQVGPDRYRIDVGRFYAYACRDIEIGKERHLFKMFIVHFSTSPFVD